MVFRNFYLLYGAMFVRGSGYRDGGSTACLSKARLTFTNSCGSQKLCHAAGKVRIDKFVHRTRQAQVKETYNEAFY